MDTLLRHWHMLRLLPRHPRKISTADIETKLESSGFPTSRRTIQRDLDKLSAEFPLVSDEKNLPAGHGSPMRKPSMCLGWIPPPHLHSVWWKPI